MKNDTSYLFYRNPVSIKKLEDQLRKELNEFTPVQNEPEAVRAALKKLRKQTEVNTAALRQGN